MSNGNYLTPAQLVDRWNKAVTTGTLSNWRSKGIGPVFTKFGRSVRYPLASLLEYEAEATHLAPGNDNERKGAGVAA